MIRPSIFSFMSRHGRNVQPPPSRKSKTVRCGSRPPEYRSARFASATSLHDSVHVAPRHSAPIRTVNDRRPCAVPSTFGRVEIGPETHRRTPLNVALENNVVFDPIRSWRTERSRKSRSIAQDRFASARRPPHGRSRKCFGRPFRMSRTVFHRTLSLEGGIPWKSFRFCEKVTFKKLLTTNVFIP